MIENFYNPDLLGSYLAYSVLLLIILVQFVRKGKKRRLVGKIVKDMVKTKDNWVNQKDKYSQGVVMGINYALEKLGKVK